jgi:hypothetical protein
VPRNGRIKDQDENDPCGSDDGEYTGHDLDRDDVDTNVLPLLLAYRDGKLVHTWVRVEQEAEAMGDLKDPLARFGSCPIQIFSIMGHLLTIHSTIMHHVIEPRLLLGARVPTSDLSDTNSQLSFLAYDLCYTHHVNDTSMFDNSAQYEPNLLFP